MTTVPFELNPVPTPRAVVREQIAVVGRRVRVELVIYLLLLVTLGAFSLYAAKRYEESEIAIRLEREMQQAKETMMAAAAERQAAAGTASGGVDTVVARSTYVGTVSLEDPWNSTLIFMGTMCASILGIFLPLAAWRRESRSHRAYHWAMPVERGGHALAKTFAGWCWLMGAVAASCIVFAVTHLVMGRIMGDATHLGAIALYWLSASSGATLAYLLGSVAMLASEHPARWITGLLLPFVAAPLWTMFIGFHGPRELLSGRFLPWSTFTARMWDSRNTARYETVGHEWSWSILEPNLGPWLAATTLWVGLALALVWLASRRRAA